MQKHYDTIAICWSCILIEELVRLGCKHVCIAPGSRSTPLVIACSKQQHLQCHSHFDERALAFFALGLAKASQEPVIIITTSGSAVGNVFPAVIEAYQSHIPLIVISADRPPELQFHGANQTINQHHIFGNYVNCFRQLPVPDTAVPIRWLLNTVDDAFYQVKHPHPGPIHFNFMFREPFFSPFIESTSYLNSIKDWFQRTTPFKQLQATKTHITQSIPDDVIQFPILAIVGEISREDDAQTIYQFCCDHHIPIATECHSKLYGKHQTFHLIDLFIDALSNHCLPPRLILLFGEHFISKNLQRFLKEHSNIVQFTSHETSSDPMHASHYVCKGSISQSLSLLNLSSTDNISFQKQLSTHYSLLASTVHKHTLPSDISLFNALFSALASPSLIFVSNSLPIRLINSFTASPHPHLIFANRGASGIDGNLSTAFGIATHYQQPLFIITGDITFLYDLNALQHIQSSSHPVKICVINNNGGQIFSLLNKQNKLNNCLDLFTTPHQSSFSNIATQFGFDYQCIQSTDDTFDLDAYVHSDRSILLEFFVDQKQTAAHINQLSSSFL